ncbi:MAG: alpha/beta hydrolase [Chloroflexi bacterium]|nr:alpha/beta hydrolase [Chloroflexota bacterium]MDA1239676.1 alpha/beta hydrolase [Chloroflexota bacterium]
MPMIDLDEVAIHYEERGNGPLTYIYCHGLGGNGESFEREEMDWYAQHFRTISWDQRGLGRSGQAAKYSLPRYAADLAQLMDRLHVERAMVFGVSWGGVLAQRFALDFPERTQALVLDSSSSETNVLASENWYLRGEVARLGTKAVEGLDVRPAFEGHRTVAEPGGARQVPPEHVDSHVAQSRTTASLREHPMTPYLHRIAAPTLIVAGGKDEVAGAGGSVVMSRVIPGAELTIFPEAGHGVFRLARDEYRALLLEFATKVRRTSDSAS